MEFKWTHLGNTVEVGLTSLGSWFKMCEKEEGEGYMKGNCSIYGVRNRMNCGALHRSREKRKRTSSGWHRTQGVQGVFERGKRSCQVSSWTVGLKLRTEFGLQPRTYESSTCRWWLKPQVWMLLPKEKGWGWAKSRPGKGGTFIFRWRETAG